METKNCARCGKWFTTMKSTPICELCEKQEEEIFKNVKQYIEDNPLSTTAQVAEGTGVSVKKIVRYIKEGRLEVTKGMQGTITCESCGKPINVGRFCDTCKMRLNQDVKELFKSSMPEVKQDKSKSSSKSNKFFTADRSK